MDNKQLLERAAKNSDLRELILASVIDAVAETLAHTSYDCTRVWSAWGYGTMSAADFVPIADQPERLAEIAEAAIDAFIKVAAQSQDNHHE